MKHTSRAAVWHRSHRFILKGCEGHAALTPGDNSSSLTVRAYRTHVALLELAFLPFGEQCRLYELSHQTAMSTQPLSNDEHKPLVRPVLASIWISALRVRQVVDADSFIEQGGDSIAAARCITRIREAFGVELPVTALLEEDATFASLEKHVVEMLPYASRA